MSSTPRVLFYERHGNDLVPIYDYELLISTHSTDMWNYQLLAFDHARANRVQANQRTQ